MDFYHRSFKENKTIVRILNFTDSYRKIREFETMEKELCDLSDVQESNGYCSDQAAAQIRERIEKYSIDGLHYLDDGNHHYLSRLWIEKIKEPFDLVVFDHHTDMQPSALLPFLSCGNWILKSLQEVPYLGEVWLIGPPADAFAEIAGFEDRVHIITQEQSEGEISITLGTNPVYISVDLDVLSPDEFQSVWDQGSMSKKKLHEWINSILNQSNVVGIDICG